MIVLCWFQNFNLFCIFSLILHYWKLKILENSRIRSSLKYKLAVEILSKQPKDSPPVLNASIYLLSEFCGYRILSENWGIDASGSEHRSLIIVSELQSSPRVPQSSVYNGRSEVTGGGHLLMSSGGVQGGHSQEWGGSEPPRGGNMPPCPPSSLSVSSMKSEFPVALSKNGFKPEFICSV